MTKDKNEKGYLTTPVIYLTPEVRVRLTTWLDLADGEFLAFGAADYFPPDGIVVNDIFLPKQTATSCNALSDGKWMIEFMNFLQNQTNPEKIRFFYHSHGYLNAFFSNVDEDMMRRLSSDTFFAHMVENKKREYVARINLYDPFRVDVEACVDVLYSCPKEIIEQAEKEFTDKVVQQELYGGLDVWKDLGPWRNFDEPISETVQTVQPRRK